MTSNTSTEASIQLLQTLSALSKANGIQAFSDGWLPPAFTEKDYHAPNNGQVLLICNIVFMTMTFLVVMARFYTRVRIAGGLGGDDYCIGAATVILIGSTALNCYGVKQGGFGVHFYDLDVNKVQNLLKAVYALPIVYSLGVVTIKLSILLFYRRLFGPNRRMQKIVLYLIIFQVVFALASCLAFALICRPVHGWWILSQRVSACPTFKQTNAIYVALRLVTVVCDIIVLVLPMGTVWQLEIPLRQRLGLNALFGLGFLACVIAVARLSLLPRLLLNMDVPWNVLPIAILDQGEQSLGIITASIPALTAIISRRKGRIQRTGYKSSDSVELRRSGQHTPAAGRYDYLSFAYDPDRQNGCYRTAFIYGGADPRTRNDGKTESDEQLVDPTGIKQTTTVTVNVNRSRSGTD